MPASLPSAVAATKYVLPSNASYVKDFGNVEFPFLASASPYCTGVPRSLQAVFVVPWPRKASRSVVDRRIVVIVGPRI